jgi:hypothetical protein
MLETSSVLAISTPVSTFMCMLMLHLRKQAGFDQRPEWSKRFMGVMTYVFIAMLILSMTAPFFMLEAAVGAASVLLYQIGGAMAVASGWVARTHPKRHMWAFKVRRFLQAGKSERERKEFLRLVDRAEKLLPPDHETHATLEHLEKQVPQWIDDRETLAESIALQRVDEAIDPETPYAFDELETADQTEDEISTNTNDGDTTRTALISPADTLGDMQNKHASVDEKIRTAFHVVRHLPHKIRNRASQHQPEDHSDFTDLLALQKQALDAGEKKRDAQLEARDQAHDPDRSFNDELDKAIGDGVSHDNKKERSSECEETTFTDSIAGTDDEAAGSYESFEDANDTDDNRRRAKITMPENNPQTVDADE